MARLLADESCDFAVVRALRAAGHDVAVIVESAPGTPDDNVIDLAVREARILITEDTDFGQLVYAHAHPSAGVILLRFPAAVRGDLGSRSCVLSNCTEPVCRPDRSDKTATWSTEARAVGGNNSQSLETKERRLSSKPLAREQEEHNGHAQQEED